MQIVYDFGNGMRMVDLSKLVDPETETRRCNLHRFNTGGPIPDFHTNFDIMSHLGTHAECPYHHDDNWPDVTSVPLTTIVGRGVYVDFKESCAKRVVQQNQSVKISPCSLHHNTWRQMPPLLGWFQAKT